MLRRHSSWRDNALSSLLASAAKNALLFPVSNASDNDRSQLRTKAFRSSFHHGTKMHGGQTDIRHGEHSWILDSTCPLDEILGIEQTCCTLTMCYYSLFLFLQCGHPVASVRPVSRAPPCPIKYKNLFNTPSQASPISLEFQLPHGYEPLEPETPLVEQSPQAAEHKADEIECNTKLTHPLHTYRVNSLCKTCWLEKETRIAHFEVAVIRDTVDRDFDRKRRKHKVEVHGRKASTLRAGYQAGKRGSKGTDPGNGDALDQVVNGLKGMMGMRTPTGRPVSYEEDLTVRERRLVGSANDPPSRHYSSLHEWESQSHHRGPDLLGETTPQVSSLDSAEAPAGPNVSHVFAAEVKRNRISITPRIGKKSTPSIVESEWGPELPRFSIGVPSMRRRSRPHSPGISMLGPRPISPGWSVQAGRPPSPLPSRTDRKSMAYSQRSGGSGASGKERRDTLAVGIPDEAAWMARDYGPYPSVGRKGEEMLRMG